MANLCIIPEKVQEFKTALRDKKINIADLINMSSEERTALLEKYAGENAKAVNTLFEEKLVLKNRMQGLKNWASKVGEIGRYSKEKKAEIQKLMSEYRAKQQERIFSPKENETFLRDLAEETLGTRITQEEAKNIFEMTSKNEQLLKDNYDPETKTWSSQEKKAEYGASKYVLESYISELKDENLTIPQSIQARKSQFKQEWKENPAKAILNSANDTIKFISDNMVSLVASIDNSFLGRQGLNTLMTHPSIWAKGAKNSFIDIAKEMKGQDANAALWADIYSNPNYIDGIYQKAGLINANEEQFPSSLPEKIPVAGRLFKASESAFKGASMRMRLGLFDLLSSTAEKQGVEMTDSQIKDIGSLASSLTSKGKWGKKGVPSVVKLVMWAPNMLKANLDVLTAHGAGAGFENSFARKEAGKNLLKIVGSTALIMMIAKALWPDSIEEDPRSSDFGKIKIGDTRFDITGGKAGLITLAARLLTNSKKSSTTGTISKFGTGYGQTNRMDLIIDFMQGKLTPAARVISDLLKGKNYEGEVPTPKNIASNLLPISIQNAIELKDNASADRVLGAILDVFGISTTSYGSSEVNWNQSTSKELLQLKEKLGQDKFQQANDKFNNEMNKWFKWLKSDTKYQRLTEEQKQTIISKKKDQVKQKIFKAYNFKYKQEKEEKINYNLSK